MALICSTLGFAFDAGSGGGNLTKVFGSLYVIGCLAAVLAVRRSGLFTAVVQPPLILFAVVPAAYFLMHSSDIHGLKDVLINCGYPLIERFPLMFFTSAVVLALGAARYYLGRSDAAETTDTGHSAAGPGLLAKLTALVTSRLQPKAEAPRRRRPDPRRAPAKKTAAARSRGERPTRRSAPASRAQRARDSEPIDQAGDRPRRRRPADAASGAEPRRRTRPAGERSRRRSLPPEERERRHRDRPDRVDRDRPQRAQRPRPQRSSRYDGYDLFGGYDPAPPRPEPRSDGNHHPVSRVRYRGADDPVEPPRRRRGAPRDHDADRWNYDI